jgi:hypothetical protein
MHWIGHFLTLCIFKHWTPGTGRWSQVLEHHSLARELGTGNWVLGTGAKSKVVTGTPSYALAWPFPDPVHLCALDDGRWALELGAGC